MKLFGFFSKEKKEVLDQGLAKTKESVFSKITRAVAGKSEVDDDVLDELEDVLITSYTLTCYVEWLLYSWVLVKTGI